VLVVGSELERGGGVLVCGFFLWFTTSAGEWVGSGGEYATAERYRASLSRGRYSPNHPLNVVVVGGFAFRWAKERNGLSAIGRFGGEGGGDSRGQGGRGHATDIQESAMSVSSSRGYAIRGMMNYILQANVQRRSTISRFLIPGVLPVCC
jgi:hypothetical protein